MSWNQNTSAASFLGGSEVTPTPVSQYTEDQDIDLDSGDEPDVDPNALVNYSQSSKLILLDSGARRHACGHKSLFVDLRRLPSPIMHYGAYGGQAEATHEGTLRLKVKTDEGSHVLDLHGARYIPDNRGHATLIATGELLHQYPQAKIGIDVHGASIFLGSMVIPLWLRKDRKPHFHLLGYGPSA